MALHLRGSCNITSVTAYAVVNGLHTLNDAKNPPSSPPKVQLESIPLASVQHYDPLKVVLTKPPQLYTSEEIPLRKSKTSTESSPKKRNKTFYHADTQAHKGAQGMTFGLRGASIASCIGELRFMVGEEKSKVRLRDKKDGTTTTTTEKKMMRLLSQDDAVKVWKQDLLSSSSLQDGGIMVERLSKKLRLRNDTRRLKRIDLLATKLGEASIIKHEELERSSLDSNTSKKSASSSSSSVVSPRPLPVSTEPQPFLLSSAFKIQIYFTISLSNTDYAGLHIRPSSTTLPLHVYTTCGNFGDHQGVRSWIPTLDSASYKHRASHELCVKVSARKEEGLWCSGCGEDFGCSDTLLHPDLDGGESVVRKSMEEALGKKHVDFLQRVYQKEYGDEVVPQEGPHIIPHEEGETTTKIYTNTLTSIQNNIATSIWVTSIWTPCPSRSLGFAIGPFAIIYDPEYYYGQREKLHGGGKGDDDGDDDQDEDEDEEEEDDEPPPTIVETAMKKGEGIRQLYFAPKDERSFIHVRAMQLMKRDSFSYPEEEEDDDDDDDNEEVETTTPLTQGKKQIKQSVLASTIGVPNRALSLMRDTLALPTYRYACYTQIWIPHAEKSSGGADSTCSGALHLCPEVNMNCFLGGAILNANALPPPGHRLPYYAGGRALQFAQARCAIRGWIVAALPLGTDDDVGQGYLHTLIEAFFMSLYERGYGSFGQGGGRGSFFFVKRFAINSGLNSPNLDFFPIANIEEEDLGDVPIGEF
eukprot:15347602-Ditylum_brightwellii.AAC.2